MNWLLNLPKTNTRCLQILSHRFTPLGAVTPAQRRRFLRVQYPIPTGFVSYNDCANLLLLVMGLSSSCSDSLLLSLVSANATPAQCVLVPTQTTQLFDTPHSSLSCLSSILWMKIAPNISYRLSVPAYASGVRGDVAYGSAGCKHVYEPGAQLQLLERTLGSSPATSSMFCLGIGRKAECILVIGQRCSQVTTEMRYLPGAIRR